MSKGEEKIEYILRKNYLSYKREFTFPHLNGKKHQPLRFDFAVFSGNNLIALIEIDGEPHFTYIPFFDKKKSNFLARKGRDRKKNEFAMRKNIPLFRIPYWELDNVNSLEDILQNKFKVKSVYHNDRLIRERGK